MIHIDMSSHWRIEGSLLRCAVDLGSNAKIDLAVRIEGVIPDKNSIFPEDKFLLSSNDDRSKISIINGEDLTKRCLLTMGIDASIRGTIEILDEGTTALVLCGKSISTKRNSTCEALVLLEVGQTLAFHEITRYREDKIILYYWDGEKIKIEYFDSWKEWENKDLSEKIRIL